MIAVIGRRFDGSAFPVGPVRLERIAGENGVPEIIVLVIERNVTGEGGEELVVRNH